MKAEIKKGKAGFYFRIIGKNGEQIASSEKYTRKEKALQTLREYFPQFPAVDLTKEKT